MNDIVDIAKVLGTAFSAMAISVADLSEIMQVSQLIEQLLQIHYSIQNGNGRGKTQQMHYSKLYR